MGGDALVSCPWAGLWIGIAPSAQASERFVFDSAPQLHRGTSCISDYRPHDSCCSTPLTVCCTGVAGGVTVVVAQAVHDGVAETAMDFGWCLYIFECVRRPCEAAGIN